MVRQELQFESNGKEKFALLILAIHNEGEKNTKYFLNLEKRHYKSSVITQFKASDIDFITSGKEILNECEIFCRSIYSSKTNSLDSGHSWYPDTSVEWLVQHLLP